MASDIIDELAQLIEQEHAALLAEWRMQVRALPAARGLDVPTLNDHIPHLLTELATALRVGSGETIAQAFVGDSSPAHGLQRVKDAFDIEEVVAEYNILRGCIHDLAERHGLNMQGKPFYVLNRVLDGAIGSAVQSFSTQKALEVQQRREEYLSFVAHDLRNPLNAIALSAQILNRLIARDPPETSRATQMMMILNRNVQHLETLVGKVIEENANLGTEDSIKVERREFDLWPLVEALIHDLYPIAETSNTRLTNTVLEDFVAYADASLVRRILQNLIANAITYTPNGEVTIGAQVTGADGDIECFVHDNGRGIRPERCQMVFDKHETDPEKEGGLGLGLAIVKTFVEAHNGVVTLESNLGVGSTFRFTLPGRKSSGNA